MYTLTKKNKPKYFCYYSFLVLKTTHFHMYLFGDIWYNNWRHLQTLQLRTLIWRKVDSDYIYTLFFFLQKIELTIIHWTDNFDLQKCSDWQQLIYKIRQNFSDYFFLREIDIDALWLCHQRVKVKLSLNKAHNVSFY